MRVSEFLIDDEWKMSFEISYSCWIVNHCCICLFIAGTLMMTRTRTTTLPALTRTVTITACLLVHHWSSFMFLLKYFFMSLHQYDCLYFHRTFMCHSCLMCHTVKWKICLHVFKLCDFTESWSDNSSQCMDGVRTEKLNLKFNSP